MADDPVSLNEVRATRENNAALWTPIDALRATLRDLESGAEPPVDGLFIATVRKDADGQAIYFGFTCAGFASALEVRGVLAQHLHDICARFRESRS